MRYGPLLVLAALAVVGSDCQAAGKKQLPKFISSNNGLGFAAAFRGGEYLTKVAMHFLGMDPPVEWVEPPKTGEIIPAWMDETVAVPVDLAGFGAAGCGSGDLRRLAARRDDPAPPAPSPGEGLIRLEAPSPKGTGPVPTAGTGLDIKSIYGVGCVSPGD